MVLLAFGSGTAALAARPDAAPYLGFPKSSTLDGATQWTTEVAFPNLVFDDPVFLVAEPERDRLWVCEREGRLVSFEANEAVTEARTVLDLRAQNQGNGDGGLLGMAFHPRYADSEAEQYGQIFVGYAFRAPTSDNSFSPLYFRLSRFQVDMDTGVADPASEVVLIQQLDQNVWHQGGALFFHPGDGFLYLSVGDEGGGRCSFGNCQRIDRDLFSGVLRIDVDCVGPPVSHAIPRQPATGTTANYCIPSDNPFVGVPNALEEFYALGLRSPHRLTHDPVDDVTWIADVGQSQREEIDILQPGANFQWEVMEGTAVFSNEGLPPNPTIGVWTPPLFDYGRSSGGTIIGGYVYRGQALPELRGRYIYGDFLSGRIWALRYRLEEGNVVFVDNEELVRTELRGRNNGGITSFGLDADGELYLLPLGDVSKLRRFVAASPDPGNLPLTLSATGLFDDLAALEPIPALVPYEIRAPLWSDGTLKRRWLSVPTSQHIGWSAQGHWGLPPGSVLVKHFELPVADSDPTALRRLETRVLVVRPDGGVYGLTYKWRPNQLDADLLARGLTEHIPVLGSDAQIRRQPYEYPGPADCLSCHNQGAGHVLGPRARQFQGIPFQGVVAGPSQGSVPAQLEWMALAGYFEPTPEPQELAAIEELAALDDSQASLEKRVRSYLDVNCSHCHGALELDRSQWDGRWTTPLAQQGIVDGPLLGDYGGENDAVVRPGDAASSVMLLRTMTTDPDLRMPPLARNVEDEAFTDLLAQWIDQLATSTSTSTTTTLPPEGDCGDPTAPHGEVTAGDALWVLRAAVGAATCHPCTCDVSGNGSVTASDALIVLRFAVGQAETLHCLACP
jgi:uncharacterized repeat protein (TIGR03806 family)